jgi:hypothetical protein
MKAIKYTFVGAYTRERQVFEGTYGDVYFSAQFGEHMLTLLYKGDNTFLSMAPWEESESERKAVIEEFLQWS